ncbi:hypothetical protein A355_0123 [Candidatus Carsonella ruddii HT isolate Thao2000]|uniref:4Fe-4S ferredoxin-type domain-containing protein n=1 Tax=Candidatus Carsonella ruddii HT isolate Thao2000 TaxID=1202539 RepID=J3VQC1_CARRU|nr:hypothetical protein [Candidatus Carsonella ruddii]AFP84151.1 hypothetical protein A355_0123 [Candidatus Carsonella ruddii HT isolate Thao2000]
MKIKNFLIYNHKNIVKNCINCNYCIIFCPKNKIYKKKKKIFFKCNFCKYCNINCKNNCIN